MPSVGVGFYIPPMPRFRDTAICLRSIEWSETSQIVVLLTERRGKVRGLAKGSKRLSPSSIARFSGGIELLQRGEVMATTKATAELAAVTEWDLHDEHMNLRRSLRAQRLAMYAAELCDALIEELDPHPASFETLAGFLACARGGDSLERELLRVQWALIVDAGFKPELRSDVQTGERAAVEADEGPALAFDARAGGLTASAGPGAWKLRRSTAALLRKLDDGGEASEAALAAAEAPALSRANRLLCSYLREVLGRELATMPIVLG